MMRYGATMITPVMNQSESSGPILSKIVIAAGSALAVSAFFYFDLGLMKAGAGAKTLAGTIHRYPTQTEGNKKAINLWRKAHCSQGTKNILTKLFTWMRRGWEMEHDDLLCSRNARGSESHH